MIRLSLTDERPELFGNSDPVVWDESHAEGHQRSQRNDRQECEREDVSHRRQRNELRDRPTKKPHANRVARTSVPPDLSTLPAHGPWQMCSRGARGIPATRVRFALLSTDPTHRPDLLGAGSDWSFCAATLDYPVEVRVGRSQLSCPFERGHATGWFRCWGILRPVQDNVMKRWRFF